MINTLNSQGYYANYAQTSTQQSAQTRPEFRTFTDDTFYVSPDYKFNKQRVPSAYDTNVKEFINSKCMEKFSSKVYQKSQSILGEVSQSKYERAVSSLATKMQEFMQTLPKNSLSYEWADRLYDSFLLEQSPETMGYDEIDAYTTKLNGKIELHTSRVQESKNRVMQALSNKSLGIENEIEKLKKELVNLDIHAKQMPVAAIHFFALFESAFSKSEMQAIIDDIATIEAYANYNAHHIKLTDGSTISWSYDKNGNMLVKINEFDINTALENADKALTEMENFKTLFEMFKQRENLNGLESGLNSENLHSNLTNSSENLAKNSNLQTKLNLINLNANSKQNLNFNTLNLSENLIANLNANSTQQSEISTPNSTNLSLQNSNHRFTMLVESENVTSIISSQSANGDTIIGMWSPMIREKGAQETSRYLSNLINSNSKVAQKPRKVEFERAVKNISVLMNELKNFVRSEQGYSQLSVDLQYLAPDDYERTLYESMQTSSNDSYDSLWMGAQIFFDFLNDKVSGLPKDEINAYISTIQAYLVATKLNANELKLAQNSLNFNSENLKLNSNDSFLKELLKSV